VIRALQRHEIPIDLIAGTSMGAVIGGAYACGVDLTKLEQIIKGLDLNKMLHFPRSPLWGLVGNTASELFKGRDWRRRDLKSTRAFIEFFDLLSRKRTFSQLEIRFAVTAVDVDTGEEVILTEGSVSRAVAAGVAIPGIHYPVRWDGRYLVDGGLINKVPADVAFSLGAEVVIAVDVSAPLTGGVTTSMEVLMQAEAIMMRELTRLRLTLLQQRFGDRLLVLQPSVKEVKTLSLGEVDLPIHAGEEEVERRLAEIKALIFD
jgi:NTE family protein